MENTSPTTEKPRSAFRAAMYVAGVILLLYLYLRTHERSYLLVAIGFVFILLGTLPQPVKARRPADTLRHKRKHLLLTLASLIGATLIIIAAVMQWQ